MDSKYVRKTVDNLLAELEKNPAIGRRPSPSFMSRYGRPLGLGIALGVSGAAGCSGSSEESKNPDALPAGKDALPAVVDVYGNVDAKDTLPPAKDAYGADIGQAIDTRDALPGAWDAYGVSTLDVPLVQKDASDVRAPDLSADSRDALPPPDTRDALPHPVDAYGIRVDTQDAPAADTQDAQPQSPEVSREVQAE